MHISMPTKSQIGSQNIKYIALIYINHIKGQNIRYATLQYWPSLSLDIISQLRITLQHINCTAVWTSHITVMFWRLRRYFKGAIYDSTNSHFIHLTAKINYRWVHCKDHPSRVTSKSGTSPGFASLPLMFKLHAEKWLQIRFQWSKKIHCREWPLKFHNVNFL